MIMLIFLTVLFGSMYGELLLRVTAFCSLLDVDHGVFERVEYMVGRFTADTNELDHHRLR